MRIVNSRVCFDKRDNCFQLSQRKIAKHLKLSNTTIDRLFQLLKDKQLTATVADSHDKQRVMLSPLFLFLGDSHNKFFMINQFFLRSAIAAWLHVLHCEKIGFIVNCLTGEIIRPYNNELQHIWRNGYNSNDRTKRRDKQTLNDSVLIDYLDSE